MILNFTPHICTNLIKNSTFLIMYFFRKVLNNDNFIFQTPLILLISFNCLAQYSIVNTKLILQDDFSFCVVKGDFNEDGKMDFITNGSNGLLLNTNIGNGEFADPVLILGTGQSVFIACSDLNNDGHLDLVYDDFEKKYSFFLVMGIILFC